MTLECEENKLWFNSGCITMSFTLKVRANKKPSGSKIITSILAIVMKKLRSQKKKFCLSNF
jgi:hypothetical protein